MDTAEVVPAVTDDKVEVKEEEEEQQEDQTVKVEEKEAEKTDTSTDPLFSYLKRGYTSEIYKIELRNLPKYIDHGQFHTFLRKQGIKFNKAKVIAPKAFKGEKNSHAYVSLRSEEAKAEAIAKLSGFRFRGCEISVSEAEPLPDPLELKRRESEQNKDNNGGNPSEEGPRKRAKHSHSSVAANIDDNFDDLPAERRDELINNQVASFWNVPYEEQLKTKAALLERVLNRDVFYELLKAVKSLPRDAAEQRAPVERSMAFFKHLQLKGKKEGEEEGEGAESAGAVLPSPVLLGYRNKCEFNIDAQRNIGFRLGQYKMGSLRVVRPPANCPLVSGQMQAVIHSFSDFLHRKTSSSKLEGFNPQTHQGHWRQILVRTTRSGECLLSVALHRQQLTEEELQAEVVEPLKRHFFPPVEKEEENGSKGLISSLYLQVIPDSRSQLAAVTPLLLAGSSHIFETLMGGTLRFRISPLSFFQVNTEAAELLYGKIVQLAGTDLKKTVVLDVCCGTGTIGLAMARSAKAVIGLELNEQAIEDAKFNAALNGIDNVTYKAGRAEALIGEVLQELEKNKDEEVEEVVAVLDPPRNGLASSMIKALRNNGRISRIVYVACEAKAAKQNFIDLCRPKSKAYFGVPFVPVSATPVDMFPHTDRCELILLFERFKEEEEKKEVKEVDQTPPLQTSATTEAEA